MIHLLPIARIVSRPWSKAHLRILYFHGIEKPFIDQFQKHLDHFSQFFRWISLSEAVRARGDLPVLKAVCATIGPRSQEASYMPAFLVGAGYAEALAATHAIPYYRISHQEGHILAGLWSAKELAANKFLAVHLSGGTTEIVLVERQLTKMTLRVLGGTTDISAGQMVDRIGVYLGLPFPAGPYLEELARRGRGRMVALAAAVDGANISFSGPETQARRLVEAGIAPEQIAAAVEECIAESVARMIAAACQNTGITDVLLVGGVTANAYLKETLPARVAKEIRLFYPDPRLSPDNAVGCAYWAWRSPDD